MNRTKKESPFITSKVKLPILSHCSSTDNIAKVASEVLQSQSVDDHQWIQEDDKDITVSS